MNNEKSVPNSFSNEQPAQQVMESTEKAPKPSFFSRVSSVPVALTLAPLDAIVATGSYVHDEPCEKHRETAWMGVKVLSATPLNAMAGLGMVGSHTLFNIRDGLVAGITEGRPAVKKEFALSELKISTLFNPSSYATENRWKAAEEDLKNHSFTV